MLLQQKLLFHDWSIINDMIVNDSYVYLVNTITEYLDEVAPKKIVKVRTDEQFREPWVTVNLKKCDNKCRKLCNKARRTKSKIDHDYYKCYRNTLNRLKLHEKRKHYKEIIQKIGKNSKLLWSALHAILKKSYRKSEITHISYHCELFSLIKE